jgi:DNA-binding MarR family transcriptional regulator
MVSKEMLAVETNIEEMISLSTIDSQIIICDHGQMANETTAAVAKAEAPSRSPHGEAWGALTRTQAAVSARLQEALTASGFPPLPWYEVLSTVADSADGRMRMGDLAEALVISRGGLTKLVDRLVKAGLLQRAFRADDRRVSYAVMTASGREMFAEMEPVVVGELRTAFTTSLSSRQATVLSESLQKINAATCAE